MLSESAYTVLFVIINRKELRRAPNKNVYTIQYRAHYFLHRHESEMHLLVFVEQIGPAWSVYPKLFCRSRNTTFVWTVKG
jgi:hypothetical protein